MGIRACCVRRDLEEERNLQKIKPNIEYEDTTKENFTKVENGGRYCTEKTDQFFSRNNNITNNLITNNILLNQKENLIKDKKAEIIQKDYRKYINKKIWKKY